MHYLRCLILCLGCLAGWNSSFVSAQSPETRYLVGTTPLEALSGPWLQVEFVRYFTQSTSRAVAIYTGAACERDPQRPDMKLLLIDCSGLKTAEGELYQAFQVVEVLNILAAYGWELEEMVPSSTPRIQAGGAVSSWDNAYFFHKQD